MERTMESPWVAGQYVTAHRCWCCHKEFTETDVLRVVDAVDPKLVHDKEPCATAVIQRVQGQ
jgi:hypothetical protein